MKKLAKDFFGQLECLGENTKKYITFSALDLCQPHYQVLLIIYLKKKKKQRVRGKTKNQINMQF